MNRSKKRLFIILLHILIWAVFLLLPGFFNPRLYASSLTGVVSDLFEPPRWTNGLLLIVVFYTNYFLIIPVLYFRHKYVLTVLSIVFFSTTFITLNYLQKPPDIPFEGFNALGNSFNLFMFIIGYIASFAICVYQQLLKVREEQLNAEISFLKAQINPHFLFNTLNSIYSLSLGKSEMAPGAIVKLSSIMRYALNEATGKVVPLVAEMEYIRNYIELQSLRLTGNVGVNFEVSGNANGVDIAPFLLIPFVENAFKYGVNSEENSKIRINLDISEGRLCLNVVNNKVRLRQDIDNGTGIGIKTTRRRLQLTYPGRHRLHIDDDVAEFNVLLQIDLK